MRVTTASVTAFAGDLAQCGNRALGVHHDRIRRHTGLRRIQRRFTAFGSTRQRRRLSCVGDERTVKRAVSPDPRFAE